MLNRFLNLLGKVFLGKGVDKRLPFLIPLFQKIYLTFQKDELKKVTIPLGLELWVSTKDAGVGLYLLSQGKFEETQTRLFIENLQPGDVAFDIGANIGYYTVLAAKIVGNKGKIYAFEPDKRSLILLRKNIELNNCQNVKIVPKAVSDKTGKVGFVAHKANLGESKLARDKQKGTMVEAISLDDFARQEGIKRASLIKLDIEGAEVFALQGGKRFLARLPGVKLFIECNPRSLRDLGNTKEQLLEKLKELGFEVKRIISESERETCPFSKEMLEKTLRTRGYVSLYCEK